MAFLSRPDSYGGAVRDVHVRETHMSWVFLTDRLVFKMKKPVRLAYLDFATLAARRFYCEESLRLNRRLAPDVYLDLRPLTWDGEALALDGDGEVVEWLERMVRLPEERMLDRLIESGIEPSDVAPAAVLLADFYRARTPVELGARTHRRRLAGDVHENAEALRSEEFELDAALVEKLSYVLLARLERSADLFADRLAAGRVVEGHGDLRPEHVCLTDPPVIIDCLEFNRELRIVDAVDELAFLALECERLGCVLDETLFEPYRRATGDPVPALLVDFYKVHRAMLRAKLAVWHIEDDPDQRHKWIARAADYLKRAARYADNL